MAKRTLEDNIERIADALERLATPTVNTVSAPPVETGTPKAEAPAKKKAAVKGDAKQLLAYANRKILAIKDTAVRKATVQAVMSAVKAEIGVDNIAQVPEDRLEEAKTIVDKAIEESASAEDAGLL